MIDETSFTRYDHSIVLWEENDTVGTLASLFPLPSGGDDRSFFMDAIASRGAAIASPSISFLLGRSSKGIELRLLLLYTYDGFDFSMQRGRISPIDEIVCLKYSPNGCAPRKRRRMKEKKSRSTAG